MRNNYPLYNAVDYFKNLGTAITSLQKMHGIKFEVFRVKNREDNNYVKAFGSSRTNLKSSEFLEKVTEVDILASPQEIYTVYCVGSGNGEMTITLKNEDLKVGDILRYVWVNNQILEFTVIELPRTFGGDSFQYRIKSTYQVK